MKTADASDAGRRAEAFEQLFRTHYARLCEFVAGYVKSRDVAQDVVQDLFVSLWAKQSSVGSDELTTAYLFVAARNRALKHERHRRVVERYRERADVAAGDTTSPDDAVRDREVREAVEAAISELPDRCREIFLLSRRQQMSYAEIAAALSISVKTVEAQMWRAFRKLRRSLSPYLAVALTMCGTEPVSRLLG